MFERGAREPDTRKWPMAATVVSSSSPSIRVRELHTHSINHHHLEIKQRFISVFIWKILKLFKNEPCFFCCVCYFVVALGMCV